MARRCQELRGKVSCMAVFYASELTSERWFVDAHSDVVRERLAKRHLAAGIETSMPAAIQRAEENDIPNGAMIRSMLVKPDLTIQN